MPLSANRDVKFYVVQNLIELPVDGNVRIFKGAFVGRNPATGFARPLLAGDDFLGVAHGEADNTFPGHTAGGIRVVLQQDIDIVHAVPALANTDSGALIYASDDSSLTKTATGNSRVGRIVSLEGANLARVRCQPRPST